MNLKCVLLGVLAFVGVSTANATNSSLFEYRLQAHRVNHELALTITITNRSQRPVCFYATNGGVYDIELKDGTTITSVVLDEERWQTDPPPIQNVPNDGVGHQFAIPGFQAPESTTDGGRPISIKTEFVVYDCDTLATGPRFLRAVYRATVSAPLAP